MDQLKPSPLILTHIHQQELVEIAKKESPLEACGLLAGKGRESQAVIQIPNLLASPTAYRMSEPELVNTIWAIEKKGWGLLAFFHSHPSGPPIPSPTDLEEYHYGEIPQIILGVTEKTWQLAAYTLTHKAYSEIPVSIV